MVFQQRIIVDAKGHIFGKLAAIVAKELLQGQKVTVVRCEELILTGPLHRNKGKYVEYLQKTCNTNPHRGARHWRSPRMIFWKAVRGMLPHKKRMGARALARLAVYEGVPEEFVHKKRLVVPKALLYWVTKPGRKYTVLGDMAQQIGWGYKEVVAKLEEKRKRLGLFWSRKERLLHQIRRKAVNAAYQKIPEVMKVLSDTGSHVNLLQVLAAQKARRSAVTKVAAPTDAQLAEIKARQAKKAEAYAARSAQRAKDKYKAPTPKSVIAATKKAAVLKKLAAAAAAEVKAGRVQRKAAKKTDAAAAKRKTAATAAKKVVAAPKK